MTHALFFDCDGTLADSAPAVVRTMEQTFRRMGVPVPPELEMRATIGLPLTMALQMLGHLTDTRALEATDIYRSLFSDNARSYLTLFPEVRDTLLTLHEKGFRLAVVTSREVTSLERILRDHGVWDLFEATATVGDGFRPKPAPDMTLSLLERMHLSPEEVIVVGDTTFDIDMGNAAGCRTIAVTYGNHAPATLLASHPTWMVDHFRDILPLV